MSYGTNAPVGFKVYGTSSSSTLNGALSNYSILSSYATAIYSGDPVAPLATGGIGIGVAGAAVQGVFQGVVYVDTNNVTQWAAYWPAATVTSNAAPANAFVVDDPNVEFSIQVGSSAAGHVASVTQADLNLNANFVIAAGSARGGVSATYLDMDTVNTTVTLNCKILRLEADPRNYFGYLYNNAIVTLNNHVLKPGTVGI
jgi:hypothetical protein